MKKIDVIPSEHNLRLIKNSVPSMRYDGKEDFAVWQTRARAKLSELMTTSLAEVLGKYDYNSITAKISEISSEMKDKLYDEFEKSGIGIESFALKGVHFNDEYKQKRTEFFDNANRKKEEKEQRRERERAQRAEIDAINSLVGNMPNAVPTPGAPSQDSGVNVPVKYCSKCGMKCTADAIFCPGCGKKF